MVPGRLLNSSRRFGGTCYFRVHETCIFNNTAMRTFNYPSSHHHHDNLRITLFWDKMLRHVVTGDSVTHSHSVISLEIQLPTHTASYLWRFSYPLTQRHISGQNLQPATPLTFTQLIVIILPIYTMYHNSLVFQCFNTQWY